MGPVRRKTTLLKRLSVTEKKNEEDAIELVRNSESVVKESVVSHQEEGKEFINNEKSIIRQLTLKNSVISQNLADFTERPAERNIKGEVVHSGNSKIFCVCGKGDRSGRCFGGSDISQVVLSFFLINV